MGENIKYRLLTSEDEKKLRELVNTVVGGLERKEFFIPYEDWEYKEMFDEGYAINYGAFDGEKLVAMGQIYVKQEMIEDYKKLLDIEDKRACELGGALCLKEYRRYGLMFHIMEYLSETAREKEFEYLLTMAHPDNIPSNNLIKKLGLNYIKTETVNGSFLRNLYLKEIK